MLGFVKLIDWRGSCLCVLSFCVCICLSIFAFLCVSFLSLSIPLLLVLPPPLPFTLRHCNLPRSFSFAPRLQIRREALAAADPDGHIHYASAAGKHLPMVDACIRESQRLYPVAPFVVRHLTSDLRLKDGENPVPGSFSQSFLHGFSNDFSYGFFSRDCLQEFSPGFFHEFLF